MLSVQVAETGGEVDDGTARFARYKYPAMMKTLGNFSLQVRIFRYFPFFFVQRRGSMQIC